MGATNTCPRLKPGSVVRCRTHRYQVGLSELVWLF
jgi:hypothetical protein